MSFGKLLYLKRSCTCRTLQRVLYMHSGCNTSSYSSTVINEWEDSCSITEYILKHSVVSLNEIKYVFAFNFVA